MRAEIGLATLLDLEGIEIARRKRRRRGPDEEGFGLASGQGVDRLQVGRLARLEEKSDGLAIDTSPCQVVRHVRRDVVVGVCEGHPLGHGDAGHGASNSSGRELHGDGKGYSW